MYSANAVFLSANFQAPQSDKICFKSSQIYAKCIDGADYSTRMTIQTMQKFFSVFFVSVSSQPPAVSTHCLREKATQTLSYLHQ
jgi:hypothetical protein